MLKDFFILSIQEIRHRRVRSILTLTGIIIGIAAIVSLIMLGQGLKNAIEGQFSALGNDKLFINAKGNSFTPGLSIDAVKITEKDLDIVRATSGVKLATGFVFTTAAIEINDQVRYFMIYGVSTDPDERKLWGESNSYKLDIGRVLENGDAHKVTIGAAYQDETLFGEPVELSDKILIKDVPFEVVGIMQKTGSPPDDQAISMPLEVYEDLFATNGELGILIAQTQSGEDPSQVALSIEEDLRDSRGLEEGKEDFTIQTPEEMGAIFGTILNIIQVVLIGIAAISLLVGGVNVMNTMYTSVLERTRMIGLMKAVGAKKNHILLLFLIESGIYGFVGGTIGVLIGIGIAKFVELIFVIAVGPAFLSIKVNWFFIIGVLLFSFIIGCLSGIAPAWRAARLHPVDGLRYE
ncbi:ABC transporter permease [Candidatus Woesearchaeota archaeon]|nr:ABC transporter permease [Candidatus Woesearchaeota archaeon]